MTYGNPYGGRTPQEGKFAGAMAYVLLYGGLIYLIIKIINFNS